MTKYQEEYLKLLTKRFGTIGKPKRATYKHHEGACDSGIIISLETDKFNPRLIFLSNTQREYFHRWSMELPSEHLPTCVWITRYTDKDLSFVKGFYV